MHSMKQIYNLLFLDNKLSISFKTAQEAERFRVKMHQYKLIQDRAMVTLGMMDSSSRKSFSFAYNKDTAMATLSFIDKRPGRTWELVIIDPEVNNETVPRDLAPSEDGQEGET